MDIHSEFTPTHHPAYWQARQAAFRAIHQLETAIKERDRAPTYIGGGYDVYGVPIPEENLGPWEWVETCKAVVCNNPNSVAILQAQGRLDDLMRA